MDVTNRSSSPLLSPRVSDAATAAERDRELKETCASFEGMFLQKMMQIMRQSSAESGLIKKSNGEKIFTDMLDEQYVKLAVKSDATGLGGTLYEHIKNTVPAYREPGNNFRGESAANPYELVKLKEKAMRTESGIDIAY